MRDFLEELKFDKMLTTINIDGEIWYKVNDLIKYLGYKDVGHEARLINRKNRMIVKTADYPELIEYHKKRHWRLMFCSTEGLYEFIERSNMPRARELRKYMFQKALMYCVNGAFLFLQMSKGKG